MAAAGPAPRGCSRAGARAFQYGAAANNTSASTQRKQHWRRTALAPAAPRLAVRAADAHRGPRSAAPPHGKRSPPGEPVGACVSRQALSFRPVRCPGPFSLSWWHSCVLGGIPASEGAAGLFSGSSFWPSGASLARPQCRKSGEQKGKTCRFLISEGFVCPLLSTHSRQ